MKFNEQEVLELDREIVRIRRAIIKWFKNNGRTYPWRNTDDTFKLLLAEIMLRRTRADQVKPVYEKLTSLYPDALTLSKARNEDIGAVLQPVAVQLENRSICHMVREIGQKYAFRLPDTREELKQLPGIGDYVAGAVLSIGLNKREWIVDNSIVRLFKRYFGIKTSKEGRRDNRIIGIAKLYVSTKDPRTANLAILDFAALICSSRSPMHEQCPLQKHCRTVSQNSVE